MDFWNFFENFSRKNEDKSTRFAKMNLWNIFENFFLKNQYKIKIWRKWNFWKKFLNFYRKIKVKLKVCWKWNFWNMFKMFSGKMDNNHLNDSQTLSQKNILGLDYRKLGNFAVHHKVLGSDIKTWPGDVPLLFDIIPPFFCLSSLY